MTSRGRHRCPPCVLRPDGPGPRAGRHRRRRTSAPGRERGGAVVEATVLLVVLVVPMFYLTATLARLQAGVLAATAASREAGRAFVTAPEAGTAPARAQVASELVLDSFGFAGQGGVTLSCSASCLEPGSAVTSVASVTVPLPLVPDFVRSAVPAEITVDAEHTEAVDEYRGTP